MPCIQVRIEVDNRNWLAVRFLQSSQSRESDAVVTAQRNQLWFVEVLNPALCTLFGRTSFSKLEKSFTHLTQSERVVKRRDWYVTTVNDVRP
jgi:hypothetical protein